MKTLLTFLTAALLLGMVTPSSQARDAVSVDFFYDNLEPHGNWREVGGYGYCWQPRDVGPDWRPYSDGRWVYTDAGWTWDSNEPFGWAVYHYGRWVDVGRVGWVWVPGTEWGPGWVSWRHSDQHVGWAPLPPEARLLLAIGLSSWVDDYYDIGPNHYRFVENRNFGARRLNSVFIDQSRNVSIINQTTNITNISYVNNVVYNGGPVYDEQFRQSHEPIQRYRLDRRQDFDGDSRRQSPEYLRSRFEGDSMSVLALPFTGRDATAPRQLGERVERVEVNNGWRNAGTPSEIAAMRERMKSREKAPDKLPPPTAFVKVTDEAAVREERRPDERPTMPGERPSKSKGKDDDRPGRPGMPPTAPGEQTRPGDRPPSPADAPKGKGSDRPGRPDMPPTTPGEQTRPGDRPPSPADAPKGKGSDRPGRPDMPPTVPGGQTRPGDRPSSPADAPKGKGSDRPGRPDMPTTVPGGQTRPGDRPSSPAEAPKGKGSDRPGRPDMPPSVTEKPTAPGDRPSEPKGKGNDKKGRPDMPPGFPDRLIRPGDRPPTPADAPKGKGSDRPSRPDMPPATAEKPTHPGDRPPTPADAPKGDKPGRPTMPPTTAEKPNRGGRNKIEAPQLPRTENRPPTTAAPKKSRESLPQIMPPKRQPAPERPKVELPKIVPTKPVPAPKPPAASRPVPTTPDAAPPRPDGKRGDRKKKKDD